MIMRDKEPSPDINRVEEDTDFQPEGIVIVENKHRGSLPAYHPKFQNKNSTSHIPVILIATSAVALACVALVLACAALLVATVTSENEILKTEIQQLKNQLNKSQQEIKAYTIQVTNTLSTAQEEIITSVNQLENTVNSLSESQVSVNKTVHNHLQTLLLYPIGSIHNPASSCKYIPKSCPSGEYWILNTNSQPIQVYCDMNRSCCDNIGGWMRVANLDMTDPSQQCPAGFRLGNRTTAPQRICSRLGSIGGCASTMFPVHGIEYSNVCGRIKGYQDQTPDAFNAYFGNQALTIDDNYVDGVSLTHGHFPRQHIWTFANAVDEQTNNRYTCPCTKPDLNYTGLVPPFIGEDYFCETGSRISSMFNTFYPDDPLWDGQGCGGNSTCCSLNNPPWFCKQLQQPTTDDIELRLCHDESIVNENVPIEMVEIYVN